MEQKWYIIHVISGFEKRVKASIEERARQAHLLDQIGEVFIPSEDVVEIRRGRRVNSERKFLPGYLLVRMVMSDVAWRLVRETPKVAGFLGNRGKPSSITETEADRVRHQVARGLDKPRPSITFEIGEEVRVRDGPFSSFNGLVEEVDDERARLKISVSIFGRPTPVELEYTQVEKV